MSSDNIIYIYIYIYKIDYNFSKRGKNSSLCAQRVT